MRYFIDCEFDWNPNHGRILPISIGIVAENGLEYYAVTTTFAPRYYSKFVQDHVLPMLGTDHEPRAIDQIAAEIRAFIGPHDPDFWGDCSAFDYVVLSMIMGEFADWPEGWPIHINDLQQDGIPSITADVPHNALSDARAVRDAWNHAFQVTT